MPKQQLTKAETRVVETDSVRQCDEGKQPGLRRSFKKERKRARRRLGRLMCNEAVQEMRVATATRPE